ncbi:NDP-hexose 2,3-enoyl reductase [Streptomyces sp. LBL]|uniref:aldo/keto reductase n=1 Tax=Streptomyces sp. LBL TaxID=2940562 RepID=UPI0024741C67|nr:aldo/keto reductase [Streptomyces sp. LBL]MDH6624411.1 NDP-hexose 2,3-enoyl reductase [Streptomyces sp. LBL]
MTPAHPPLRRLGVGGPAIHPLVLGTMNFGPHTPEPAAHRILCAAVDLGITLIDTANVYGWRPGGGWTEQIIGRWLKRSPHARDRVLIATKAYRPVDDWPNSGGLSALSVRRACERSLRNLGVDTIDLFFLHHVDRTTPIHETLCALESLRTRGLIRSFGYSNFAGWHLAQAQETARTAGFPGGVAEQCLYNPMVRAAELDVIPACTEYGMGTLAWSPLNRGLLAGLTGAGPRRNDPRTTATHRRHTRALEGFWDACAHLGIRPAQAALAWVLRRVTAAVIGPRTEAHLRDAAAALDLITSEELFKTLDTEIDGAFPPPRPLEGADP